MNTLIDYLNSLSRPLQDEYARRCGTTVSYLRKAASIGQRIGEGLCIALDRESGGSVSCEQLRPDVDWAYLRFRKPMTSHGHEDSPHALPVTQAQGEGYAQ